MDLIQNRRRDEMSGDDMSFFNIVPSTQFNPPNAGVGNLMGVQFNANKTIVLMPFFGSTGTTPTNQNRIQVYSNSNTSGVIESASNLTFLGQTNELNYTISGVRQEMAYGMYWNSTVGKLWCHSQTNLRAISEYSFDLGTLTATFIGYKILNVDFNGGNFYFSEDGMRLFTCGNQGGVNYAEYSLSTAFTIGSTITLIKTKTLTTNIFANAPVFYSSGNYGVFLTYVNNGSILNKRQFGTPYDYDTVISGGVGYGQYFYQNGGIPNTQHRVAPQLPLFLSNNFKRMNYFWSGASPGRIGVGTFDIPLNFRGNGDLNGGIKVGTTIVTPT